MTAFVITLVRASRPFVKHRELVNKSLRKLRAAVVWTRVQVTLVVLDDPLRTSSPKIGGSSLPRAINRIT